MDRISLTWGAALADPSATAVQLRGLEEQAEAFIVRSRTLRQWLENVPPFSAVGISHPTAASDDDPCTTDRADGEDPDGQSPAPGGGEAPSHGAAHAGPRDNSPEDAGDAHAQPTAPTGGQEAVPDGDADGERDEASEAHVPPPRAPAGDQDATAKPRKAKSGRQQKTAPPTGEQLTLHQRVEAVLERFRPGAPLTVRNVALMIGHTNLRSLRPVLDRMTEQGLLVKTELHPRAVVYHRPEAVGSPTREATMF
ncbi:hypothetical protein EQK42_27110 [Streptomyces albidoflavus]|uniref:hypothetical protein n=1 Tax=Actinomycetes TaxID=1760 RepID=UPI000FF31BF9|nr:hypothetical protein [Streptomyces albidoflavus]RWZ72930.1 hypothetical protein EQK42_27110 [Streptomyces albidoflavus]